MNRAERRANKVTAKEPVYHVTMAQLQQMKDDACSKAVNTAFGMMLALPYVVLKDKYGFGRKRLGDFLEILIDQYQCFDEGFVELDELLREMELETGLEINAGKWKTIAAQRA